MKSREFISLIIIDLLFLVSTLVSFFLSLSIEISVSLMIIVFIVGAIILYREEKRKKELRFINRLKDFLKVFNEKITDVAYTYSLISIAFRIANDETIREKTIGWHLFLQYQDEELTKQGILLNEKVKQRKEDFTSLFEDFKGLLSLLRNFKKRFYDMVNDTKKIKSFSNDSKFKKEYKRFYEEFNKYMDKLDNFSDEVKAEFEISLSKDLTEHVKDFNELHPEKVTKL